MATQEASRAQTEGNGNQVLFWGCFLALITTAFAFMSRLFLLGTWSNEFGLDEAQAGRLLGIGIWPFAVSIIFFSLVIDKIGYKNSMYFAFGGHMIWTVMGVTAYFLKDSNPTAGYQLLYWGSLVCALANGTVEAFINPVVATMFHREKTKWLNILHAGWPGGLVITGLLLIGIDNFDMLRNGDAADVTQQATVPWAIKIGLIALPAIVYFLMLVPQRFPASERVTAGVSYREMLQEFGVAGALIVAILLVLQLMDFFNPGEGESLATEMKVLFVGIGVAMVAAFGAYTRSLGRPLLIFLLLIMMPLATTEIGTDGWITAIMEGIAEDIGFHPNWILVYTSAIMLVLRFMAGPIVHALSPLGLLAVSCILAIAGLMSLSTAQGIAVLLAATLYGFGKTFFWPTMLGVVSEQCPKGGALTLNAIAGIGMLAVGTLGAPYIGALQTKAQQRAIVENDELQQLIPGLVVDGRVQPVAEREIYEIISYRAIDGEQVEALITQLPDESRQAARDKLKSIRDRSNQRALADIAIFPMIMLVCYIALIIYFKARGGYQAEVLTGHAAKDEEFTGGVEGPVDG